MIELIKFAAHNPFLPIVGAFLVLLIASIAVVGFFTPEITLTAASLRIKTFGKGLKRLTIYQIIDLSTQFSNNILRLPNDNALKPIGILLLTLASIGVTGLAFIASDTFVSLAFMDNPSLVTALEIGAACFRTHNPIKSIPVNLFFDSLTYLVTLRMLYNATRTSQVGKKLLYLTADIVLALILAVMCFLSIKVIDKPAERARLKILRYLEADLPPNLNHYFRSMSLDHSGSRDNSTILAALFNHRWWSETPNPQEARIRKTYLRDTILGHYRLTLSSQNETALAQAWSMKQIANSFLEHSGREGVHNINTANIAFASTTLIPTLIIYFLLLPLLLLEVFLRSMECFFSNFGERCIEKDITPTDAFTMLLKWLLAFVSLLFAGQSLFHFYH